MTPLLDATTARACVEVHATPERAFHVFTAEIGTWWDADRHILAAPLAEMEFEPFAGGRIIDRGTDGSECRWARVLVYDPPARVVFSWDIDVAWQVEADPSRCSEVELTFTAVGEDRTRVQLTHRHLDRHGPGWEGVRDALASGWSLTGFAAATDGDVTRRLPVITDEAMRARLGRAKPYTVAVLHTTDACVHPDVDPIIWEHGRRNLALVESGELLVVLPVSDDSGVAGVGVFGADRDRVAAILDEDPGIRAGILRYELHPAHGFPGATLR